MYETAFCRRSGGKPFHTDYNRKDEFFLLDGSLRIIFVFTDLIAPLIAGYFLHRYRLLDDAACNHLIRADIVVINTVLALLAFWNLPLSSDLLLLPIFGLLYVLLPGAIGHLFFARCYRKFMDRGSYMMSAMLTNIGTLSGVCAFIMFSETGFAYAQIISTFQNFLIAMLCFPLAQYYHIRQQVAGSSAHITLSFRGTFLTWNQLVVAGMAAGLLLNYCGVVRPQILGDAFQALVHIGAWMALLPVGFLIDFYRARHYLKATLNLLPLRFIVTPLAIYLLARPLFSDLVLLAGLALFALAPTAVNAVLASRLYSLNVDLSIASFLSTTALYLLLVFPLYFAALRYFF